MKYRDILGFSKLKKKVIKEQAKPKKNKILENVKQELNESEIALGIQTAKDNPAFKTQKQIKEGPAYEYKKDIKNIDKSYKLHAKSLLDFYEKLRKKGLDDEASDLLDAYKKNMVTFKKAYDNILRKIL